MKKYAVVLSLLLAAFLAAPASSHALGLEAAVGGWMQSPSGTVGYETGIPTADSIDLEKDAGFDDEIQAFGRAKIDLPIVPNVYLMATPMKFDGKGQKNVNFQFGDFNFTSGVDFEAELTLDHYDIAVYYGIPFLGMATLGKFGAEVGVNLRLLSLDVEVTQPATGLTESESFTLPVPMLYAGAQFKPIDLIAIEAEFRGVSFDGNDYFDYIGRLKVKPFGPLFVAGGYRHQSINLDNVEGITVDADIGGPFFEVGIELDLL
jgi:outer membrane protein